MDHNLVNQIKQAAAEIGFVACGVTTAEPFALFSQELERRQRLFPEVAEQYAALCHHADPKCGAAWAQSVVVCIRAYGKYRIPPALIGHIGRSYLGDMRLKACPDNQMPAQMTQALRSLGLRAKRGGGPDRLAAARAGAVQILRNGFAYHENAGSWLNVLTWRVDAELPADKPTYDCPCPPNCRLCMTGCPTGAIVEPYVMRMDKCVAHLTYNAPHPISAELWSKMGAWIYGCDVCQQVCPLNRGKWCETELAPWLEEVGEQLSCEALATMDAETYQQIVHPRFWYIPAEDSERWRRNARRALQAAANP